MVCRDNVEDPLDDTGTVQQQLDQVNLFCFVLYLTCLIVQWKRNVPTDFICPVNADVQVSFISFMALSSLNYF